MNLKRTAALVATSTLLTALAGCGTTMGPVHTGLNKVGSYNAFAKRNKERGGTWTILIHMAAENNLYRFGLEDLNEMEAGVPTDGSVNVYVLFDGIKNGDSGIYHVKHDPAGMNGNLVSEIIDDGGAVVPSSHEIDSGDARTSAKFAAWAAKNAPADHTFLGYWDHGSGIFQGAPNPITKGFAWDDRGSNMSTADITPITGAFKAAAGKPLAGLGFDACLMAHGEIAFQAYGNVDYLVASEQLEPGKGWDYTGWLNRVGSLKEKTPAAVAAALVDSYASSYESGGSQSSGRDDTTLSATDINAFVGNVVPAIDNFVAAASRNMGSEKANYQAARAKAKTFYNRDCADLGSFLAALKATSRNNEVTRAAADVEKAYASAVIREDHSASENGATGLVMYFPTPTQRYNSVYDDASKIAFSKTAWKNFLKAYR